MVKKLGDGEILNVKKLTKEVELPEYVYDTDVGLDLRANEDVTIAPFEQKTIKTGIAIEIPAGCVGLVRDRVGILTKMNVHTSAGTFDSYYRGEISIVLTNFGEEDVSIEKGMRIAQLIILPVIKVKVKEVKQLSKTSRSERSFGSTGVKDVIRELEQLEKMVHKSKKN
ncbi:dUTP diphosphatase [Candidatus Pacearchaeota archaeon]|nr:dUTP diphosphatase [Candidatus Pacearchaeota archaeon]